MITNALGHRKVVMTTPKSRPFTTRGPETPYSGLKLVNSNIPSLYGQNETSGQAAVYELGDGRNWFP